MVRNFETVEAFIKARFGKEAEPGNRLTTNELITSLSVQDTINGRNAIVVLSKTEKVADMLVDAYGFGKTAVKEGIKLIIEGSEEFAAMICYHTTERRFTTNP